MRALYLERNTDILVCIVIRHRQECLCYDELYYDRSNIIYITNTGDIRDCIS